MIDRMEETIQALSNPSINQAGDKNNLPCFSMILISTFAPIQMSMDESEFLQS